MNGPGVVRPRQQQRSPAVQTYTIIAVGQRCVGKSSLLRLLLDTLPLSPNATNDQLRSIANFVSSSSPFCECHIEVLWNNERLLLHLIDTPPLNGDTLAETIALIEERYIRGARSDDDDDSTLGESHVHLCLYLLDVLQHDFRPDITAIARLSPRVNVLPVLARSDVLTLNELINLKQSIRARLADAGLGFGIFDKQGDAGVVSTKHSTAESPPSLPLLPYSIFTPEHSKLAYEPVLNLWMDKLDRRRAEFQSLDTKMDIDRKLDEPSSSRFIKAPSSRTSHSPISPPSTCEESDAVSKREDPAAVPQGNDNGKSTPFPTHSSPPRSDEKYPRTPSADPSAPPRISSSPSAVKDGPVRSTPDADKQQSSSVPNAEGTTTTTTHNEDSGSNTPDTHNPERSKVSSERSLATSPQNGFHPKLNVSPSINHVSLNSKPPTNTTAHHSPNHMDEKHEDIKSDGPSSPNDLDLVSGKFVRVMRWGVLDCADSRHSDFSRLREEIMTWRKELKAYTREYLYSCFKDDSFSRLAAQAQQHPQQRDAPSDTLLNLSRRESFSRECAYRVSPPPSLQHAHRGRSTSMTESTTERDRSAIPRSMPSYSIGREREPPFPYERERDLDHRYPYHDRPRNRHPSPDREQDYHAAPRLSPHAGTTMPLDRKLSVSNGDRERPKYRESKHETEWEDQRPPTLPSIDRGERYSRISPSSYAPPPPPPPLPTHCHPGPYPPQFSHGHIRDKEHFDRERGREKISPLIHERDIVSPPLQRSGSPGVPANQHGQSYVSGMINPNISPNMAAGGKQLDVHSLLNHNHHASGVVPGIITQGLEREKEWERRDRDRELSPNSATLPASGVALGMPISNMPMSSGHSVASVVGAAGPSNNVPPPVPNTGLNSNGRKRKITMACNFCRSRKLKCDGVKPACAQCIKRGNNCDYQQHAVVPPGPSGAPKDAALNSSQARDAQSQANVVLPPAHVSGQLASPGLRHREREREYGGREQLERNRDAPLYHSGRPYSPPPQPPPGSSSSHGHPYPPQNYPPNYPRLRESPPPPPHHVNASGATHTWRYTSQSHAQAHAAARDSDVDELMEDLSEHDDPDVRLARGMKSNNRDFAHTIHGQANGGGAPPLNAVNGRKRVSVDMLIVEALGEGGGSNGPVEEDGGMVSGRGREHRAKDREKGQNVNQHQHQVQGQAPPPSGMNGPYEGGSWYEKYEMGMGVIDVGSEGDKKKRLNRQSANYGSKAVACVHCRARKTRCDAVRPACGNCARRSLSCSYNHTTPSQPRSKGKKAAAAAAAAAAASSTPGSTSTITSNGLGENDMGGSQPHPHHHQQSLSPHHSRSPGQVGTSHPLPSWHHSQPRHNAHAPPHSPIRIDDHRLPIEESAERERPLTRSPQPPIATLNVPERSRSRSSSGSLSTGLMENGSGGVPHSHHHSRSNVNGSTSMVPVSRSRSTSNFTGADISELSGKGKRKSPDVGDLLDASVERGIMADERNRERPDKRRKHWIDNPSSESPNHLSSEVRVQ